jgi:hypothetical protein
MKMAFADKCTHFRRFKQTWDFQMEFFLTGTSCEKPTSDGLHHDINLLVYGIAERKQVDVELAKCVSL